MASQLASGVQHVRVIECLCVVCACNVNMRAYDAWQCEGRAIIAVADSVRILCVDTGEVRKSCVPATKRLLYMRFPYVCPEPVLAKSSFLYINTGVNG